MDVNYGTATWTNNPRREWWRPRPRQQDVKICLIRKNTSWIYGIKYYRNVQALVSWYCTNFGRRCCKEPTG